VTVTLEGNNKIHVAGAYKQAVGQFAAAVRHQRKPEPYKGKGIRYEGEASRSGGQGVRRARAPENKAWWGGWVVEWLGQRDPSYSVTLPTLPLIHFSEINWGLGWQSMPPRFERRLQWQTNRRKKQIRLQRRKWSVRNSLFGTPRAPAAVGVPQRQAHLRPGHRRPRRPGRWRRRLRRSARLRGRPEVTAATSRPPRRVRQGDRRARPRPPASRWLPSTARRPPATTGRVKALADAARRGWPEVLKRNKPASRPSPLS